MAVAGAPNPRNSQGTVGCEVGAATAAKPPKPEHPKNGPGAATGAL